MAQLVECVPNFSEGRNKEVIDAISLSISSSPGCSLLDVDSGASTHRSVFTFVGSPESVVQGALNAASTAFKLIDMTRHSGEHPRSGALDVCPFVPVQNVSMDDCVRCAETFGKKLAEMLHVPVYLYGEAARKESRRNLPSVRAGEYEALPEKLKSPDWSPDFGPALFVPSWGATVTGARKFLIAFNVNLIATKEQTHRIALDLREQGRGKDQPGRLQHLQALGWFLEEQNLAQVSTNLLDFERTALHTVYLEVCREAQELQLPVVGSQLVGLVPLRAIMAAADFFINRDGLFIVEEEHKVRLVISKLGLDSLAPFNPKERIIEYMVGGGDSPLVSLSLRNFVQSVASRTPAPGGGQCPLPSLPWGRRWPACAAAELLTMVDRDASAFSSYMAALKMPKNSEEEKQKRDASLQDGLRQALSVPLALADRINLLWAPLKEMVVYGNIACKSDAQVAAKALETAVFGAYYNVMINLRDVSDPDFKRTTERRAAAMLTEARESAAAVLLAAEDRK
ncbi:Formimidoyltransferase-cyclodeaminase [Dissostichus eleginoides]|uniref:Formimidoyltransferase-cyclodeaminase n=1 Tax=Dissostichus eleginoides TaxID=100907 RepID=A0AAD9ES56_DISEL|nr:Formimidoyltransferase-cyclodeaminase [Dissostichus eleginoides]